MMESANTVLNAEQQEYADMLKEFVAEISSFARILKNESGSSLVYVNIFSKVPELAKKLEKKYGREYCLRVVSWHVLSGSTPWQLDGEHEYELDFPGKDNVIDALKQILNKLRGDKK